MGGREALSLSLAQACLQLRDGTPRKNRPTSTSRARPRVGDPEFGGNFKRRIGTNIRGETLAGCKPAAYASIQMAKA